MNSSALIPKALADALVSAERLVALTGSGVSAESGIPTFREAQTGLWSRFNPHELATPEAFAANPRLVWEWYTWRRQLAAGAEPNAGHHALATLEQKVPHFTLITQNVDGLHQLAGNHGVLELHGNIQRTVCAVERTVVDRWPEDQDLPPRCPTCREFLRPDVVWFGESLPSGVFEAAIEACRVCDLFLSIGTSAIVEPAASLALVAAQNGALVAEINAEPTPLTPLADFSLMGRAGVLLPALCSLLP